MNKIVGYPPNPLNPSNPPNLPSPPSPLHPSNPCLYPSNLRFKDSQTLKCKDMSNVQISYSHIKTELTKRSIWYFLCMLLVTVFHSLSICFSISRRTRAQKGFVRPSDHFHQFFA